jgi:chemotaxis family two-component system response regulator Rcp1
VLLVEDSLSDAYLVRLALERISIACEVTHCSDSEDALLILSSCGPAQLPDLVILDLNTPRKNGFELLADLHKWPVLSAIPVLVLTSSISPDDKQRAERLGVSRYVSKPLELDEFLHVVGGAVEDTLARPQARR